MKYLVLIPLLTFSLSHADPLIILPVGDSITQGGKRNRDEFTYRLPLQRILHAHGIPYDFIGSRSVGLHKDATWPDVAPGTPFDPDHEGYYGNRTRQVTDKVISAWTENTPAPDMVLIHLGTNDQKQGNYEETVAAPLRELIRFLREKNPRAVILLGYLNFNDSPGAFRIMAEISELKTEMNTSESPVRTVQHYQNFIANPKHPQTDTFDWAHPNPRGQQKMAETWFNAMKPFLQNPTNSSGEK